MNTTISTKFEVTALLPAWAQNDQAIVERCKNDLAFRSNVCAAETQQRKRQLQVETYRLQEQVENQ